MIFKGFYNIIQQTILILCTKSIFLELFDDLEFMLNYSPHSSYTSTDDFHLYIYVYIWTQEISIWK